MILNSLQVKVIPNAHRNEIVGWENGILKIRLKATPEKGKANQTLIDFLAEIFNMPKSHIVLVRGKTSRYKQLSFKGVVTLPDFLC